MFSFSREQVHLVSVQTSLLSPVSFPAKMTSVKTAMLDRKVQISLRQSQILAHIHSFPIHPNSLSISVRPPTKKKPHYRYRNPIGFADLSIVFGDCNYCQQYFSDFSARMNTAFNWKQRYWQPVTINLRCETFRYDYCTYLCQIECSL